MKKEETEKKDIPYSDISRCFNCKSYDVEKYYCNNYYEMKLPQTSLCSEFVEREEIYTEWQFKKKHKIDRWPTEADIKILRSQTEQSIPKKDELEILKDKAFFDLIDKEFDKTIVKENSTRRAILLICLGGKLTINAQPTSKNLMVNDDSGAGKDYITNSILKMLPDVIRRKRISEKAFTYWHNAKFEEDWTWDGKIFYNEDISNSILNSDVFKVMASSDGENQSTITIQNKAIDIITKGKPVLIITVAMANPKQELLRRFPITNLNTSQKQTDLILKRKAEFSEKGINPSYSEEVMKCITKLKRIKVKVPFASKLVPILNTSNIIIRTHFDRLLDYVKFSAAIHQYQREKDDDGFIIAEPQDYDIGREVFLKTTSNIFSIPLTKNQQKILDKMKELSVSKDWFSVGDLETHITFISSRSIYKELDKLTNLGFLGKDKQDRDSSKKPVMVYKWNNVCNINIPTWKGIENTSSESLSKINSNQSNDSNNVLIESIESNELNIRNTTNEKEKELIDFLKKNPLNNVTSTHEKFQDSLIKSMKEKGFIFESSSGTYKVM